MVPTINLEEDETKYYTLVAVSSEETDNSATVIGVHIS